jgi:hypothetical protein
MAKCGDERAVQPRNDANDSEGLGKICGGASKYNGHPSTLARANLYTPLSPGLTPFRKERNQDTCLAGAAAKMVK